MKPEPKTSANSSFSFFSSKILAILAGVLILGMGLGIGLTYSLASSNPENVANSQYIDMSAPNAETCVQYGASAITVDARLFVTLNPFSVYISQPRMQPGCVLHNNTWSVLEQRKLLTAAQERECKNRMNTFGFTGTLEDSPQIDCVYKNDAVGNRFLRQAGIFTEPRS